MRSQPTGQSTYVIMHRLGEGTFGEVFEAKHQETGKTVAIKRVNNIFNNTTSAKSAVREAKLLNALKHQHPNILSLEEFIRPQDPDNFETFEMVLEHGSFSLMRLFQSSQVLNSTSIEYILHQTIQGAHFLHSIGIIHRDLKLANILINPQWEIKIADFGMARVFHVDEIPKETIVTSSTNHVIKKLKTCSLESDNESKEIQLPEAPPLFRNFTSLIVTEWYRPPEVILALPLKQTPAIDMWSIGCIGVELLAMLTPQVPDNPRRGLFWGPYRSDQPNSIGQLFTIFSVIGTPTKEDLEWIETIKEGDLPWSDALKVKEFLASLPSKPPLDLAKEFPLADPRLIDLLKKMLVFNPAKRITSEKALEHPYLQDFETIPTPDREAFKKQMMTSRSFKEYLQFEIQNEKKPFTPKETRKFIRQEFAREDDFTSSSSSSDNDSPQSSLSREFN